MISERIKQAREQAHVAYSSGFSNAEQGEGKRVRNDVN